MQRRHHTSRHRVDEASVRSPAEGSRFARMVWQEPAYGPGIGSERVLRGFTRMLGKRKVILMSKRQVWFLFNRSLCSEKANTPWDWHIYIRPT